MIPVLRRGVLRNRIFSPLGPGVEAITLLTVSVYGMGY